MEAEPASPIAGVRLRRLAPLDDDRGGFMELHRLSWLPAAKLVQWNTISSLPGVLRGLHLHRRHSDLLFLLDGRMRLGLKDLRGRSPTALVEQIVEMDGAEPLAIWIPNGVAHGFYAHTATRVLYAVDEYFDPADELGCRWDDPGVGLFRDLRAPQLSARDAGAPSLAALRAQLAGTP